jgi:hypothetical protein
MPLRTLPRYFLMPPLNATAGRESASVIDLSLGGTRLELSRPLPVGSRQRLRIETVDGVVDEEATVLWCQIDELSLDTGIDHYLAGLEFDQEPTESVGELIERLLATHAALPVEDARTADRYRLSVPLTGILGILQVEVVDLCVRGARISIPYFLRVGTITPFAFQVDVATGPVEVLATVAWCLGTEKAGFEAGLKIDGEEERLRAAIHRLCMRDEARIDLHSLRRKFEALRQSAHEFAALAAS